MQYYRRIKHFLFEEDSLLSWIVSIILAYLLIKFIVYPGLGFLLGTKFPIVAVVSSSMEHPEGFDAFFDKNQEFYAQYDIDKEKFQDFSFKNGFNKGDIMILVGAKNIKIGDIIVFQSPGEPIIHRVIKIWQDEKGDYHYQTKGDNNPVSIKRPDLDETDITQDLIIGKAAVKVPLLGWIKIAFVELLKIFNIQVR